MFGGDVGDPSVVLGSITLTPNAATAIGDVFGPTVILGSMIVIPGAVTSVGDVGNPIVIIAGGEVFPTIEEIKLYARKFSGVQLNDKQIKMLERALNRIVRFKK